METASLGSLLEFRKGKKPKTLLDEPRDGFIPYIDISAVEKGTQRQWADPAEANLVSAGSLVIVWDGARSGWVGFTQFAGALGSTLAEISSPLNSRYLAAFLKTRFRDINSHTRGSGIPHVNPDYLKNLRIPVLSVAEQDSVAHLSESVSHQGKQASDFVETSRSKLERARASFVAAACNGRLTARWRDAHPQHEDDLEEALHRPVTRQLRRGVDPSIPPNDLGGLRLPDSWLRATVAQLLACGALVDIKDGNHGSNHPKVAEFTNEGLPFVTANCVQDGRIDYQNAPKVSGPALRRLRVGFSEPGDVILTHKGTVGRVAIADEPSVLTPQTTYYRCNSEYIEPRFLALFLESPHAWLQMARVMSQTTRDFVPISEQYKLTIAIPPIAEQREIAHQVGEIVQSVRQADFRVEAARRRIVSGVSAVLKSLFENVLQS